MTISELVQRAHDIAALHGFWDDVYELKMLNPGTESTMRAFMNNAIGNRLMLIVSEVAEAQEALRNGDEAGFREELADLVIRACDLAGGLDIDLEAEILKKMERNRNRPYKHGKAF